MNERLRAAVLCGALSAGWLGATPALAQPVNEARNAALRARHEILVMERILEEKVQLGARMLHEQFRAAGVPDVALFAGEARARGIRLDGYGILFNLDVPAIRLSTAWSLRVMDRPDPDVALALEQMREFVRDLGDATARTRLDEAIALLDTRVGGSASDGTVPGVRTVGGLAGSPPDGAERVAVRPQPATPGAGASGQPYVLDDPGGAYTAQVRAAVIDAMFDHSGPMALGGDDWFTVAAREDMLPRFVGTDPNAAPRTMILRVRGADLAAFREGRLSREEAIGRVEVTTD